MERRLSLEDAVPTDVLGLCVEMLAKQANHPEFVAAFCRCNQSLRRLLPADLQKRWLDRALQTRPSSSEVRAMGLLQSNIERRSPELQKALVSNAVAMRLRRRPQPASLLERGVLKAELGTSLSLIEARERLRVHLCKNVVQRALVNGPRSPERAAT